MTVAVTMKMISRTKVMSTSGVTLMPEMVCDPRSSSPYPKFCGAPIKGFYPVLWALAATGTEATGVGVDMATITRFAIESTRPRILRILP